jgi:hypothetical protein
MELSSSKEGSSLYQYITPAWRKRGLESLNWTLMILNYFSEGLPDTWECGINKTRANTEVTAVLGESCHASPSHFSGVSTSAWMIVR